MNRSVCLLTYSRTGVCVQHGLRWGFSAELIKPKHHFTTKPNHHFIPNELPNSPLAPPLLGALALAVTH